MSHITNVFVKKLTQVHLVMGFTLNEKSERNHESGSSLTTGRRRYFSLSVEWPADWPYTLALKTIFKVHIDVNDLLSSRVSSRDGPLLPPLERSWTRPYWNRPQFGPDSRKGSPLMINWSRDKIEAFRTLKYRYISTIRLVGNDTLVKCTLILFCTLL